jgi:hypothetical protein
MSRRLTFFIINVLFFAGAAYLLLANTQPVVLQLGGNQIQCTGGGLLFGTYALGFVVCFLSGLPLLGSSQGNNIAKLKEWQGQDAKLLKEIQTDKEKQLEAKIATLEAALKQALKK